MFKYVVQKNPDYVSVLWKESIIGEVFKKKNHPKPTDFVLVVTDNYGNKLLTNQEDKILPWLVGNALLVGESWAVEVQSMSNNT